MSQPLSVKESKSELLREFREGLLGDLDVMRIEYTDAVRADGSPNAYRDWFNTVANTVEGVKVEPNRKMDNWPTVNVYLGSDFISTGQVTLAPAVVDVEAKEISAAEPAEPTPELPESDDDCLDLFFPKMDDIDA